jgi:hypothetical protein
VETGKVGRFLDFLLVVKVAFFHALYSSPNAR